MFFCLTMFCCIDRANLAFAAVQLNEDLGFDDLTYGIGSSVYFFGYSLFQVPSNLMLVRVGARPWLAFLVTSWGVVAAASAWIRGPVSFGILRFLLGTFESGTVPGMWYHMSQFYPASRLGVAYSAVGAAFVLSNVIGGPLAAALMSLDGLMGLSGWRWLFLTEGVATIAFGLYVRSALADSLEKAPFLRPSEVALVQKQLLQQQPVKIGGSWGATQQWRTWYLGIVAMLNSVAKYGALYWTPLIIYSLLGFGLTGSKRDWMVGLLTAVPYGLVAGATVWNAQHAKKTGERKRHVAIPMAVSSCAFAGLPLLMERTPVAAFLLLIPATMLWAMEGVFMSWPAMFLEGAAAATGVAIINTMSNIGGLVGPALIGILKESSGNYNSACLALSVVLVANCVLVLAFLEPSGSSSRQIKIISISGKPGAEDGTTCVL